MPFGSKLNNGGLILQTNCFTLEDVDKLIAAILSRYGITTHTKKNKGLFYEQNLIYLPRASVNILRPITHMHSDMMYKINKLEIQ